MLLWFGGRGQDMTMLGESVHGRAVCKTHQGSSEPQTETETETETER